MDNNEVIAWNALSIPASKSLKKSSDSNSLKVFLVDIYEK